MTKKETIKFIVQIIASVATAIVTALGATSCMGPALEGFLDKPSGEAERRLPYCSEAFSNRSSFFIFYSLSPLGQQ